MQQSQAGALASCCNSQRKNKKKNISKHTKNMAAHFCASQRHVQNSFTCLLEEYMTPTLEPYGNMKDPQSDKRSIVVRLFDTLLLGTQTYKRKAIHTHTLTHTHTHTHTHRVGFLVRMRQYKQTQVCCDLWINGLWYHFTENTHTHTHTQHNTTYLHTAAKVDE